MIIVDDIYNSVIVSVKRLNAQNKIAIYLITFHVVYELKYDYGSEKIR